MFSSCSFMLPIYSFSLIFCSYSFQFLFSFYVHFMFFSFPFVCIHVPSVAFHLPFMFISISFHSLSLCFMLLEFSFSWFLKRGFCSMIAHTSFAFGLPAFFSEVGPFCTHCDRFILKLNAKILMPFQCVSSSLLLLLNHL